MAMLASIATNDSTAATFRLVGERQGILADNTQSIEAVASEAEHLRQCFETLEKSNSKIIGILASQEQGKFSEEQISEMLRKLSSVMTTDVLKLTEDLKQIRQNTSVLRELVQKMRELKSRCEAALLKLQSVTVMDEKSIQDLTILRVQTVHMGLQSTCHGGSFL
jgi:vacuolar-type H+-ATPase subunit F/Vma7